MKKMVLLLVLVTWIISCSGCTWFANQPEDGIPNETTDRTTENTDWGIEDFSGTEFETYEYMFSEIATVTLYQNGNTVPLETNDPRIIRLLNYLSFAVSSGEMSWIQGHLDAEWMEDMESRENRLEVEFRNDHVQENMFDLYGYDKLIVTGRWCNCISFVDDSWETTYETGKYAVCFTPGTDEFIDGETPNLLYEAGLIQ